MTEVITEVRRKGGCATVVFESGKTMRVPHALYMLNKLRQGQEIDPEKYELWRSGVEFSLALERAAAFLQTRERASGEIRSCLARCGYRDDVIEKVILTLTENRFVSDARFAGLWVDARAQKLGRGRIRQELRMKGVNEEAVRQALDGFTEEDETEQARIRAEKLMRRETDDKKVLNALIRRGYSFSVARRAIEGARKAQNGEAEEYEED